MRARIMICISRSPASARRSRARGASGIGSVVGGKMRMLICGNQRILNTPAMRPNGLNSGPSIRTGTTVAPDLAAINAAPS